jgi:hypothetical protein
MISPSSVQAVTSSSAGRVFAADGQAVIARGGEGVGQACEDALVVVADLAGLAVHDGLGADHVAAIGLADGLVAQAHAQDRQVVRRAAQQRQADAGLVRRLGARRQQHGGRRRPRASCTDRASLR